MPENKDEWIVIAQGEDGLITHRNDDFEPVMNQIDRYVNAIDGYQLDLDWKQICDRVTHLPAKILIATADLLHDRERTPFRNVSQVQRPLG
jgi:hypothetical protein